MLFLFRSARQANHKDIYNMKQSLFDADTNKIMANDMFSLTWKSFHPHLSSTFKELYTENIFADVTLLSDERCQSARVAVYPAVYVPWGGKN